MTFRLVLLPSTLSVALPASANLQVYRAQNAPPASAKPQVEVTFQARTLASFRCEGSFVFLQRVERRLLGLACKIVPFWQTSLGID